VGSLALNTTAHADAIADLNRMGLDTVRIDDVGRVEVISREYDEPPTAQTPQEPGPTTERPRRWWQRRVD
jgi:hypothetical protein